MLSLAMSEFDDSSLMETALSKERFFHIRKSKLSARRTLGFIQRQSPLLVEWEIFNRLVEEGFDLNPERDNKSKYHPQDLVPALARYGQPVHFSPDMSALQRSFNMAMKAFGNTSGDLTPIPLDDTLRHVVWMDKSSGLPECTKKGEAFDVDIIRARKIARGEIVPPPCIAYHRVQHGKTGPKTRLVWGYPQAQFLLEARFAPKLLDRYLERRTPMAIGLFKSQIGSRMARIRNAGVFYSVDFSGFDSSIPPQLISMAFDILKSHFAIMSEEEEISWNLVVNYFIHTPIMMPNQQVWRKHHGVPSGSYFTSMVDSIVNFMAINYAWIVNRGEALNNRNILVLGDDSLVGHVENVPLIKLAEAFGDLNLTMNVSKTRVGYAGKDWPHFLGHDWKWGMPDRPLEESAKQSAFPEKPSRIKDSHSRAMVRVFSRWSDATSIHKLLALFAPAEHPWVIKQYSAALWGLETGEWVERSMRPGFAAHMEEMGTLDPISVISLVDTMPFIGAYL